MLIYYFKKKKRETHTHNLSLSIYKPPALQVVA